MSKSLDRRSFLSTTATAAVSAAATTSALAAGNHATKIAHAAGQAAHAVHHKRKWQNGRSPWPICLDTATIRPASLADKIRIASEAGFDAIEPWEGELHQYERDGGDLKALGAQIRDKGLFVPSVIGLWNAIPPTEEQWQAALPDHRRRMRQAAAIGAEHIQVVPQPARPWQEFDLRWASLRYRDLLEIGLNDYGINPAMVFVNFLEGVRRFGQAAAIALDADHPKAKIIPDVFHMFIAYNGFNCFKHIQGDFIAIFQLNDAPAGPSQDELANMKVQDADALRVFPGDGVLPLADILKDVHKIGYTGCISLELYNREYYKRDLKGVASEGLEKTIRVIEQAVPS